MARPLRNFDVNSVKTVADGLKLIDRELKDLRSIALDTDFDNQEHTNQFSRNSVHLKRYYEKVEVLIHESTK